MLKKWIVVGLVAVLSTSCADQVKETNAVAGSAGESLWVTDFAAASAKAKTENKYMLLDFSGSDWCGWCIKLDKEVFSQKEFVDFAAKNLVLVLLDFPNKKQQSAALKTQNDSLSKQYKVEGFPTILILDPQGKLVHQTGYRAGGAAAYVAYLNDILANDRKKGSVPSK